MRDIVRKRLEQMIYQYGPEILNDHRRCVAILRDLCPENRREVNLLAGALRADVAGELNSAPDSVPKELLLAGLIDRLYDEQGFAREFSAWAVETLALALKVVDRPGIVKPANTQSVNVVKRLDYAAANRHSTLAHDLRSKPIKTDDPAAPVKNGLTPDRHPLEYIMNDYEDNGNGTVTDFATGLMWQKGGSENAIPCSRSRGIIQKLNHRRFAWYDDWRLPTVDELVSLIEPDKQKNELFIDPVFDSKQWWCWSVDERASSGGAWDVNFRTGSVSWAVRFEQACVRAVRL